MKYLCGPIQSVSKFVKKQNKKLCVCVGVCAFVYKCSKTAKCFALNQLKLFVCNMCVCVFVLVRACVCVCVVECGIVCMHSSVI